ncbi:MAG: dihydropteroate synthase [Candidatus Omnitrophota bacterium]
MRIIQVSDQDALAKLMREIKVDPYGIEIMLPKAVNYVIKINSLPSIQANILKQEMLSLGGDVAVTRAALTGKARHTDCLIIGSLAQYRRLCEKLKRQPFGLSRFSTELSAVIADYERADFKLDFGRFRINAGMGNTRIWGIVNLTPDSFSGDGLYRKPGLEIRDAGYIIDHIYRLVEDGADVIDIGGESTRPGALPVPLKEEVSRVIPVIKKIAKKIKVPISVDTYKPAVAEMAIDCGASVINDISGLRDQRMVKVAAKQKCGVVIMHCQGKPATMQVNPKYGSLIDEVIGYLRNAIIRAQDAGIGKDKIVIDPGLGFGKTLAHNLQIVKKLGEFKVLGKPILIGPSRKAFIGKILNVPAHERVGGTLCASVLAVNNGASFLRVHDVKEVKQAIIMANSITNA